jgi:hypothetical protein
VPALGQFLQDIDVLVGLLFDPDSVRKKKSYVFFFVVVGLPCDSSLPGDL